MAVRIEFIALNIILLYAFYIFPNPYNLLLTTQFKTTSDRERYFLII